MNISKATNILIGICLLLSVTLSATESKQNTQPLRDFASDLRYIPEMQARAADSIYLPENNIEKTLDRDSLFALCAEVGYEAIEIQMQRYYEFVDVFKDDNDRYEEIRRMRETVQRIGGSILKRELEYGEIVALPDFTPEKCEQKIAAFQALADKCIARKDYTMEMRILIYVFRKLYLKDQYYRAFLYAGHITERLNVIPDTYREEKKNLWYEIGRIYFDFHDYEHAVPCLKAALLDEAPTRYYSYFNLQARNALGLYYREIGQLDSADYYFRSMLESKDRVKMRPMYDCIALSNLAANYRRRRLFHEALQLHQAALPVSLKEDDHSFTSGIYVGLAECYLETGDPVRCKAMIDSALYHIEQWPWVMLYRSCDLYPVMARYYSSIGDNKRSMDYMDSTTVANQREEKRFSGLLVLRANQELFESERARKEVQLNALRRISVIMGWITGAVFIVLLIILYLYRKKQKAYREMAASSREWAERALSVVPPAEADTTDVALVDSLNHLIDTEKIFLDSEIDLENIAQRLGVHRNMISKAVNTGCGKPFSAYINEFRVRNAILLLSDPANDHLTLETIAFDSGFSSRTTFYRAFKTQTGLNPANYRRNRG